MSRPTPRDRVAGGHDSREPRHQGKPRPSSDLEARRRRRGGPVYLFLLATLIACLALFWYSRSQNDPYADEVTRLVGQLDSLGRNSTGSALAARDRLSELGTNAYPRLARLLLARDTRIDRVYDASRRKIPPRLRSLIPPRQPQEPLRERAVRVLRDLGPAACRAMVGAIEKALDEERGLELDPFEKMELLRALYWSIPESPKAVETLRRYLAEPNEDKRLFGMGDAEELWPKLPQFAPLLVEWLHFGAVCDEAAEALGLMGPSGAIAIPALIEVCEEGVAGNPPNREFNRRFTVGDPFPWNRAQAARALGRIGVASPEVLATLERGWASTNDMVRASAAFAVGDLGAKALSLLPGLLGKLDSSNRLVLEFQLEAIGRMGPQAREAIPILQHWADPENSGALPAPERFGKVIHGHGPRPLPVTAAMALLRIDPDAARPHVPVLVDGLLSRFPGSQFPWWSFSELRPLSAGLVPRLEAGMLESSGRRELGVAFRLLGLDPAHPEARQFLLNEFDNPDEGLRFRAVYVHWVATGETEGVLPRLVEHLADELILNHAAELGSAAKPLVPHIEPLLHHPEPLIRTASGKALRRIAPEKLPPIHEEMPR